MYFNFCKYITYTRLHIINTLFQFFMSFKILNFHILCIINLYKIILQKKEHFKHVMLIKYGFMGCGFSGKQQSYYRNYTASV